MRGIEFGTRTQAWHYRRSRVISKWTIENVLPFAVLILFMPSVVLLYCAFVATLDRIHEANRKAAIESCRQDDKFLPKGIRDAMAKKSEPVDERD